MSSVLSTILSLTAGFSGEQEPSCPIATQSVCYRNPDQILATLKVKDAAACCSECP